MLKEIRAHALLEGVRGQPAYDKDAIVEVLLRIGQLVQDFPEIAELDINPLMVYPQNRGAIAIDMRLVLSYTHNRGEQPMKSLYVTSVERYSGKTATCLALGTRFPEQPVIRSVI
jgi:hypothetical protein